MSKLLIIGNKFLNNDFRNIGVDICCISDIQKYSSPDDIQYPLYRDLNATQDFICQTIDRFKPDALLEVDSSRPILFYTQEEIGIPKYWYAVDTHLHFDWHQHYAYMFDGVFCAQQNIADTLKGEIEHITWLPLFFKGAVPAFTPWDKRSRSVSFVGTLNPKLNPDRCIFFNSLKKEVTNLSIEAGDFIPIYSDSRLVINQSVSDDLNFRFFEAPGCGAFLITDRLSHSCNDILEQGEEYLSYEFGNVKECVEHINFAIHDFECERKAQEAYEKIKMHHTSFNRVQSIIESITNKKCINSIPKKTILEHYISALSLLSLLRYPPYLIKTYREKILELQKKLI